MTTIAERVNGQRLTLLDNAVRRDDLPVEYSFADLQSRTTKLNDEEPTTHYTRFFDVVDVEDEGPMLTHLDGRCFREGPLSFNLALPQRTMEDLVIPNDGGWKVIKHAHFKKRCGLS